MDWQLIDEQIEAASMCATKGRHTWFVRYYAQRCVCIYCGVTESYAQKEERG